jgi:DnaK suppressor protein
VDLDAVRADLEQIVREAVATIAVLEAEAEEEEDEQVETDLHSEDNASEITEADRVEALIEAAEHRRAEGEAALKRLEAGVYGVCVDCGEQIATARLEFRPEAARCLACQELFEQREG